MEIEWQDRENDAASAIIHLSSTELSRFSTGNPENGINSKGCGDEISDIAKIEKEDERKCCGDSTVCVSQIQTKQRLPKIFRPNSRVSSVRSLLSTGLLEGIPIKYSFHKVKSEVPGLIKDLGYLCGCSSCNYQSVLNAADFGRHLGVISTNHNDRILLSNGKSLFQVIKELKHYCLNSLESVIESTIGCIPNWESYKLWRESFQEGKHEFEERNQVAVVNKSSITDDLIACLINSRSKSSRFHNAVDGFSYPSRTTRHSEKRRNKSFCRMIFKESYLPDGAELAYCIKGRSVLKGYKAGSLIECCCCNMKISPSKFEVHAGWASRHQPYRNIFTSSGVSLYDLCDSLSKNHHFAAISSECSICGDGGEMVSCSRCPKTFHLVCLGLDYSRHNEWLCSYCNDEIVKTSIRVIRPIKTPTIATGCCTICRSGHFSSRDTFNDETVLICDQCEKEFHVGCLRKSGMCDLKALPRSKWFCQSDCMAVYDGLQKIITSGSKIVPETSKILLVNKLQRNGIMVNDGYDARWRLLSGKIRTMENKIMLSKAFQIFRNNFDPIIDRSGRDLIPAMIHGRDMGGYELRGMHCAILSIQSAVVSAAILRVLGREAAELSLAATWQKSQRHGFFGCLLSCVELLLHDLNVETLILEATENAELMWVEKFGFREMAEERCQRFSSIYPLLMFKGTKMLEKPLYPSTLHR